MNINDLKIGLTELKNQLEFAKGNWGHKGRPGAVGGSSSGGSGGLGGYIFGLDSELLNSIISKTKETGKEHGIVILSDGRISKIVQGDNDSIRYPSNIVREIENGRATFHLHSHPNDTPFSPKDLASYAFHLQNGDLSNGMSVGVIGVNGNLFVLKPKQGIPLQMDKIKNGKAYAHSNDIYSRLDTIEKNSIRRSDTYKEQFEVLRQHIIKFADIVDLDFIEAIK